MAHYGSSSFFGYREKLAPKPQIMYTLPPGVSFGSPALNPWDLAALGYCSYYYQVYGGDAGDEFPSEMIQLNFPRDRTTRQILFFVFDNAVDLIVSYDGSTESGMRFIDKGFLGVEAIKAFKVRNFIPGMRARYQFVMLM